MELASRQIQVEKGDNHLVAVERNIVIDEASRTAAEVKKTTVLVDLGGGKIGQATATEITAVRLGPGVSFTKPVYILAIYNNSRAAAIDLSHFCLQGPSRPALRSPQPSPARGAPPPYEPPRQNSMHVYYSYRSIYYNIIYS